MSVVVSKAAEPYAEALLDLSVLNNSLKEMTHDMTVVSQLWARSSDLKTFLSSFPAVLKIRMSTVAATVFKWQHLEGGP